MLWLLVACHVNAAEIQCSEVNFASMFHQIFNPSGCQTDLAVEWWTRLKGFFSFFFPHNVSLSSRDCDVFGVKATYSVRRWTDLTSWYRCRTAAENKTCSTLLPTST